MKGAEIPLMFASGVAGAKLDSWGDLATYTALPFGVYWLWPGLIAAELDYVLAVAVAYTLPIAFGLVKFRRLTSYHTWGAKASAIVMGGALLLLTRIASMPWSKHQPKRPDSTVPMIAGHPSAMFQTRSILSDELFTTSMSMLIQPMPMSFT